MKYQKLPRITLLYLAFVFACCQCLCRQLEQKNSYKFSAILLQSSPSLQVLNRTKLKLQDPQVKICFGEIFQTAKVNLPCVFELDMPTEGGRWFLEQARPMHVCDPSRVQRPVTVLSVGNKLKSQLDTICLLIISVKLLIRVIFALIASIRSQPSFKSNEVFTLG